MPQAQNDYAQTIEDLTEYFRERLPDCRVVSGWKIDYRYQRFYFEKGCDWLYILDLSSSDLREQGANQIITGLEADEWGQRLAENSGKRIPIFSDKRFSSESHPWPNKVMYRRG